MAKTTLPAGQAPYQQTAEEVTAALGSDPRRGLSAAEIQTRLKRFGPNELEVEQRESALRRFLAQFQDTLVVLLLIATAISVGLWLYERDTALPYEGLVIFAIVLLNGILGYVQEERAEQALTALRAMSAAKAHVVRDGERQSIPARELVPGDLMLIEEGDTVPADGRLLSVTSLQVNEASLTGESVPVEKNLAPIDSEVGVGDRVNMVFSGTAATYGRGRALVTATGMQTEMGRIAGMLHQAEPEPTPLQRELDRTGRVLGGVVLAIAAVVVAAILLMRGVGSVAEVVDVLILGVALAVAAVPEGLPAVVTAVLAIGVQRMARRKAIIRRLPAVETLGSATVIASDKTGTLTKNEMTVQAVVTASGRVDVTGSGYAPEGELRQAGGLLEEPALRTEVERTLRAAALANNARLQQQDGQWTVLGDPTEGALLVAARKAGLDLEGLIEEYERVGEVPFSSERKRMSTAHRDPQGQDAVLYMKGAPDVVLAHCTQELVGEEARPLDEARRTAIQQTTEKLAREALRTLAMACRSIRRDQAERVTDEVEQDLVFLGLVGMIDPPRAETPPAVDRARSAGIRPIMITGDHPQTAAAIAEQVGISADGQVVLGAEVESLSEEELKARVRDASVYARVNPEHKLRIVQALQETGSIVAMTGDGVNDAPALRTADIGVAMGITGTDVSKEAADMVLSDDNFATIVSAVEEGRSIFANIQKFLRYLLASNVGEVFTMFFGIVLAGVLGLSTEGGALVLPLLATQILWINLVTDGPPALALGLDPPDPEVMRRKPRPRGSPVITGVMWASIGYAGLVMAIGTLLVLDGALPGGLIEGPGPLPYGRTMAFTTLVLYQLFHVFVARSDIQSAFRGLFRNRWLLGAVLLSLGLQVLVVYAPFLQPAFQTVPLAPIDWLICLAVASSVLWTLELAKLVARRAG